MLDSLVRVSRRDKEDHFTNTTSTCATILGLPQDQAGRADTPRGGHLLTSHLPRGTDRCWPGGKPQRPHCKRRRKYDKPMDWFPSLPLPQFQVLFNSLFKVLCIFPSRYLCTIGFPPVFSFRRNLPPDLNINPKMLDSLRTRNVAQQSQARTGVSPSQLPFSKGLGPGPRPTTSL